jgi:hypothetical protein
MSLMFTMQHCFEMKTTVMYGNFEIENNIDS